MFILDCAWPIQYLNNIGDWKRKFNNLTKNIVLRCIDDNFILSSDHVAGSDNLTADRLSRDRNADKEWELNTYILYVDLFAPKINKHVTTCVFYYPVS